MVRRKYSTSLPSVSQLIDISEKTQLQLSQIQNWFKNKRRKMKKNGQVSLNSDSFTNEDKIVLIEFFKNKTDHPGPDNLSTLSVSLKKDMKKIRQWFAFQRFKKKHL